jgi:hypothetical protein
LPVGDECFADDAIDQVTELTSDVVWLETEPNAADDEDLTGYAWVDQEGQKVLVNQRMIAEGFGAYAVSEGTVRFRDWLSESEVIAKAQGAGLWGTCTGPHGTLAPTPTPEPVGTRDNPVEFGEEAEVGDWAFVVTDVAPDATELVLAQNQFNDPPADGRQFFMVAISATYNGKESSSLSIVGLRAVGESNVAYDYRDVCSYDIPDPLPSTEVFEGGTVSGNYCWSVRTEDVDSLVMYVDVGYTSDNRVYFSLRKE